MSMREALAAKERGPGKETVAARAAFILKWAAAGFGTLFVEAGRRVGRGLLDLRIRPPSISSILLAAAFAAVLAGIAHILSILFMPALAERNAYARLEEEVELNTMTLLPDPTPRGAILPMMDPAFVTAVCLFDLAEHPLKISVPATGDYTSVSFYTAGGNAFYAVSDQAAGRLIELDLMTADQRAAMPEDEEVTAADRLIVEAPSTDGIVLVRAFARERGVRDAVRRQLEAASCTPAE